MAMNEMLQRAQRYVGMPYVDGEFDCADLAVLVQREVFGREVAMPGHRRRPIGARGQAREIHALRGEIADPVDQAATGCAVLMFEAGAAGVPIWHVGTAFVDGAEIWVLHNSHALGSAFLQRLVDMQRQGMRVEGFYSWRFA